MIIRMPGMAYF